MLAELVFILIFILFYFLRGGWGGGCGKCTMDHALGSCRGRAQTGEEQPLGAVPDAKAQAYLASEPSQCSSDDRLSGLPAEPCLSCRAPCWETSDWACEDADPREDNSPLLGTLAQKGCWPRLSQLGGWRRDLPPRSRGLGLPAKAAAESAHATASLPSVCPAFQLNPNYKWV